MSIVIYIAFLNFTKSKISYILFLAFSGLSLIYNQLFLNFFMDSEAMIGFYNNSIVSFLKTASYLLLLVEIVRFYKLTGWKHWVFTMPLILLLMGIGVYFQIYLFQSIGLLIFIGTLYFYYKKTNNEVEIYPKSLFYIWYFYTFLKLSNLFTMYLYDYKFD